MVRGEKPIELGDSWFSTKSIEVERYVIKKGGRALDGEGWPKALPTPRKLRIPFSQQHSRQTLGAKVQSRKGKSPDRALRSLKICLVGKDVI